MPNTNPPIINQETLVKTLELANASSKCDFGLFLAATADNHEELARIATNTRILGVKMYLNNTFGELCLPSITDWVGHFEALPKYVPICVHAERQTTSAAILMASLYGRHVHICHVAREEEIIIIKKAKEKGINVTCEVAPHHLFLCQDDVSKIGQYRARVKPELVSPRDRQALWDNLEVIDVFATDHAPHLVAEKDSETAPPGYPGLETMMPLLLTAVKEGRLTLEDVVQRLYYNPKKIFNLPDQFDTYIEIDLDERWTLPSAMPFTKSKWTPFAGREVCGQVRRVLLHGEVVFVDGNVLVANGFGRNCLQTLQSTAGGLYSATSNVATSTGQLSIDTTPGVEPKSRNQQITEIYSEMFKGLGKEFKMHSTGLTTPITAAALSPRVRATSMSMGTGISSGHGLAGRHILSVSDFTREQLHELFNLAHKLRICVHKEKPLDRDDEQIPLEAILKGKMMASVFYEVSTRTSCSFAAAMQRLGGGVIYMNEETSSVKKGESLEDSVIIMANYADVVVLRHPLKDAAKRAAKVCGAHKPLINAGDGIGEHPTQALLDVFTIREEIGTINNLTVS